MDIIHPQRAPFLTPAWRQLLRPIAVSRTSIRPRSRGTCFWCASSNDHVAFLRDQPAYRFWCYRCHVSYLHRAPSPDYGYRSWSSGRPGLWQQRLARQEKGLRSGRQHPNRQQYPLLPHPLQSCRGLFTLPSNHRYRQHLRSLVHPL